MKKQALAILLGIIIGILFMRACNGYAQEISFRVDMSNALRGSDVNPPAFNWKVGISDYYNGTYTRLGMEYESFGYLNYQQWTFMKIDQEFPINDNLSVLGGVGVSQIYRKTKYAINGTITYAFNLELSKRLSNGFGVSIQAERERATDVSQMWRDSLYFGIIYRFNE